ncbi:MAG: transposase zinc-binding domain-containing protein, partial [Proteobacteria bacterium]|nr:transposase zinc-binding domain-containing protein [Pseudomonadota bacterium]
MICQEVFQTKAIFFHTHLEHYESRYALGPDQRKAASWHIMDCRAAALRGHAGLCNACGHVQVHYNSCRDRHCPKCQTLTKERWLEKRKAELLPVHYFHVVFTLPHEINPLAAYHTRTVYNILFRSVSDTLKQFTKDRLKEEIGFMAILHTWDQKLNRHLHIHCIVPCLDAAEFIRRFMQHILPSGFMKIRSYGFLANRHKK